MSQHRYSANYWLYMDNYFLVYNESADLAVTHVMFGRRTPDVNEEQRGDHVTNTWSYKESS
jgi:hypothetical protein